MNSSRLRIDATVFFQSPIPRVGHCNLVTLQEFNESMFPFSPLFQGSVTATPHPPHGKPRLFCPFSPLFQGSVTATYILLHNTQSELTTLSVPYSKGRSLQLPKLCNHTGTVLSTFQSPIPRVGHCNDLSGSPGPNKLIAFQSPIPRVGHCNEKMGIEKLLQDYLSVPYSKGRSLQPILSGSNSSSFPNLSVPYSKGRSLQLNMTWMKRQHSLSFQSPIPRVGHCNGTYHARERLKEKLSVPYSKGRSLQLRQLLKTHHAASTFSPLFQGSVTATPVYESHRPHRSSSFQSPIPRVGHCNEVWARKNLEVMAFQSPIPRVGHCN